MSIAKAANIADRANRCQSAIYPKAACASTARRQIAAADRAQLHPLGPWTGADGPAAGRPLRQLQRPPLRCNGGTKWWTKW